jgi:hypothetical protein
MMKKEEFELNERLYNVYCGILFHSQPFCQGEGGCIEYDFDCLPYRDLLNKYPIQKVAGYGSDFVRAQRINKWLAPRLKHNGTFDNSVECNSLALLDYCFDKKEVGINCLNKAKILEECCLALGIYARRIGLYPYSPYDQDNHVVTEIFDRKLQKWIMLDPTFGSYVWDGVMPLSCYEMREHFAAHQPVSAVLPNQRARTIQTLTKNNMEYNAYYAKNCFYFTVDFYNGFGTKKGVGYILPQGFDLKRNGIQNTQFAIDWLKDNHFDSKFIESYSETMEYFKQFTPQVCSSELYKAAPYSAEK